MNNSRRKFMEKGPILALAAGVGIASTKVGLAATPNSGGESTRALLDVVIQAQGEINGKLYAANHLMVDVLRAILPHVPVEHRAAVHAKLVQADGYIDQVPGAAPPGCILPPDFCYNGDC